MQVIRFNTGGIGGKPQIAELRKDGKDWKAAMVDADEMMQQVQALEKYLGDYGQVTAGENVTPVPKPGDQN